MKSIDVTSLPLPTAPGKNCDGCSLCCKLVSVSEINKPKNRWCIHSSGLQNRCKIYETRPQSCVRWSCAWLVGEAFPIELKPNRSHVVFDIMPDVVGSDTGPRPVVQLWVDAGYPDAHRAPLVRAAIEAIGRNHKMPTLARIGDNTGILIVPPCLSETGDWIEIRSQIDQSLSYGSDAHLQMMKEVGLL